MLKQKIIRIASDPDIATEQISDAIINLDGYTYRVMPIYPDTVLIEYDTEGEVSDSDKYKVLRIASDPDIATEQINKAIEAIYESYDVRNLFVNVLYSDTLLVTYDYNE